MKKLCWVVLFTFLSFSNIQAQGVSFGATGGLFYGSADASILGYSIKEISNLTNLDFGDFEVLDGGGFYAGFLADIELIQKFHVQPELLYANAAGESLIIIPVMAKLYVGDAFNLQVGPQLDFLLNPPSFQIVGIEVINADELFDTTGFSLNLGAGFDINDRLAVEAKYSIGLNNRANPDKVNELLDNIGLEGVGGILAGLLDNNANLKTNILQAGLVYKF